MSGAGRLGRGWLAFAAALALQGPSQAIAAEAAPPDLSLWGLHCFCITAVHTPHGVVREGANGRALYFARSGASMRTLRKAGLAPSPGALQRMVDYGLLAREGDRVRTLIPVVDPQAAALLRRRVRLAAEPAARALAPSVAGVRDILARRGLVGHDYAVVFGAALDGRIWDLLGERGLLPSTALDSAHPIWRGAFWAIYPERKDGAGTNDTAGDHATLVTVWNDRAAAPLQAVERAPGLAAAIDGLIQGKSGVGLTTADGLTIPLTDAGGHALVPVLDTASDYALSGPVDRLAQEALKPLLDDPSLTGSMRALGHGDEKAGRLIVAHEYIWALADALVEQGLLTEPDALAGSPATASSLGALIYVRR
jgi:hypothetical protein